MRCERIYIRIEETFFKETVNTASVKENVVFSLQILLSNQKFGATINGKLRHYVNYPVMRLESLD
jgi:hypothetical protein